MLTEVPMLATMVRQENAESIELLNRVEISVSTCNFKTIRGRTVIAALCDELCFWPSDDSANPDTEVLDALRPAMSTIPNAMLLCASSPYAHRGAMYDAYRRFYGEPDAPALVWKAATRRMNSTVPQRVIDEAMERDPASAAAEFMAEFRSDCEALISREAVEACIQSGVYERQPERRHRYCLGVDISGGVHDASTLCIAHREGETVIVDKIVARPAPHSPEVVIEEFATIAKAWRCTRAIGDKYAGNFVADTFRRFGLNYEVSDRSRSELYRDFLPLLNSRGVDLLDNDRLVLELIGLERRTFRGGADKIDHGPGGHDDVANDCSDGILATGRAPKHCCRPSTRGRTCAGADRRHLS